MKKYGFTLIEVIVNITIIMIIFSTLLSVRRIGVKIIHDIKVRNSVYEVMDLLSYGKALCNSTNSYGKIIIDYNNKLIKLRYFDKESISSGSKEKNEKVIKLPEDTSIITAYENIKLNEKGIKQIDLTNEGKIANGYTIIIFDDSLKKQYKITIGVGTDLITLKEEEI